MMKYFHQLAAIVLAIVLLVTFPMSAQAASSSSISRATSGEIVGKNYSGKSLQTTEFANANLEQADFSNADLRGAVFNGAKMAKANLHGADFTNGIAYLVDFKGADLSDAILVEAMMLRSTFNEVNIEGADFTNAVLDRLVVKQLCTRAAGVNSKTGVATRESLGCR